MSFQAMAWAIEQRPENSSDKFVLLMLANYASSEDGACFPSLKKLATDCLLTERGVRKVLRSLEAQGFIETASQTRANGSATVNRYRLIRGGNPVRRGANSVRRGGELSSPLLNQSYEPVIEDKNNLVVSQSKSKATTSKNDLYLGALEVWRAEKRDCWTDHRVLSKRARGQVDELVKAYGSQQAALEALEQALRYAAEDSWWGDKDVSFENIGSKGRFAEFADRYQTKHRSDRSNTRASMRARAEREAGSRDATEQEWSRLDDQTKMLFVKPGQVRDYHNGQLSGRVIVTRTQGSAFWLKPEGGGREFMGQMAWLGRETLSDVAVDVDAEEVEAPKGTSRQGSNGVGRLHDEADQTNNEQRSDRGARHGRPALKRPVLEFALPGRGGARRG